MAAEASAAAEAPEEARIDESTVDELDAGWQAALFLAGGDRSIAESLLMRVARGRVHLRGRRGRSGS